MQHSRHRALGTLRRNGDRQHRMLLVGLGLAREFNFILEPEVVDQSSVGQSRSTFGA
jgi:hypothetical protein